MLDLTFHAIEYAAYQPYMFNDPPDACAKRAESEAKPGRYRCLPPASPRVSLIQPFASSVARLVERILTAMHLRSAKESESNKAYGTFCEDCLRQLEGVFNGKEPAEIFARLANFCECRRRIANLNLAVESLNDPITTTYFSGLKRLIGIH